MDTASTEPAQSYILLRSRTFNLHPAEVGLAPSAVAPHVWGVVMETGYPVGTATLLCLVDGTTSLYYSTGGGMLGSAEYAPVAEASKALVTQAESQISQMVIDAEFPLPQVGQVRFYCLTYTGIYSAQATEVTLKSGGHPLTALYVLAHNSLNQLRLSAEKDHR